MTRPDRLVAILVALILLTVAGCTGQPEATPEGTPSPVMPSPVEGRIGLTCQHLSHHPVLRPFIGESDDEFPHNAVRKDDRNSCVLHARVAKPVEGWLTFWLRAEVLDPDRDTQGLRSPNLEPCTGDAQCWIAGPTDCTLDRKPPDEDFRTFAAEGRAAPYKVRVDVGVWPDDFKRNLCEADRWSKIMAAELLNEALRYLLTGT